MTPDYVKQVHVHVFYMRIIVNMYKMYMYTGGIRLNYSFL